MNTNQISSIYLTSIFQPWYRNNVFSEILDDDHPLCFFQLQTKHNYTIHQYIKYMFVWFNTNDQASEMLISTQIYLERLFYNIARKYGTEIVFTHTTIIPLFFTCFLLASKYNLDDSLSNKDMSKFLFGENSAIKTINELEIIMLQYLDYRLYISPEQFQPYSSFFSK
jgi:hypothetical protein